MKWRPLTGTLPFLVVLALVVSLAAAAWADTPQIVPTSAKFKGQTYGEWGALWWTTLFSIPVVGGNHPFISGGAFGGANGVLFLAGTLDATYNISIAPGTSLFVPVINVECSTIEPPPFHGDDEASLRACANGHIDHTSLLSASIDGVPVADLAAYRVESPLFQFTLADNNLFEFFGLSAPAGTTVQAVDAGVYLLLRPLGVGAHLIQTSGTFDLLSSTINPTYNITVVK